MFPLCCSSTPQPTILRFEDVTKLSDQSLEKVKYIHVRNEKTRKAPERVFVARYFLDAEIHTSWIQTEFKEKIEFENIYDGIKTTLLYSH